MKNTIEGIIEFIECNLRSDINMQLLSRNAHYSPTHLSRLFARHTGMTISEYIIRRRLSIAAVLLKGTSKSVNFVAHSVGYNSAKYFSSSFKDEFGVTPREYRNGNVFVSLTNKRIVKGGYKMKYNTVNSFCESMFAKVTNVDELYNTVACATNVNILHVHDADVLAVIIIESEHEIRISQVEVNLISKGVHISTIFTMNPNEYQVSDFLINEEYLIAISDRDGKVHRAKFRVVDIPIVDVSVESLCSFDTERNDEDINGENKVTEDDIICEILDLTNDIEVDRFVSSNDNLILVKHFGSVYHFIRKSSKGALLKLDSIYLDASSKASHVYTFFKSNTPKGRVEMLNTEQGVEIIINDKPMLLCKVIRQNYLKHRVEIEFENGARGTGDWSL